MISGNERRRSWTPQSARLANVLDEISSTAEWKNQTQSGQSSSWTIWHCYLLGLGWCQASDLQEWMWRTKKRHNSNKGDVNIVGAKQQVERKLLSGFKNCLLLLPQSNRNSIAALALEEWQSFGGFQVFYWWQLISNRKVKNQLSQKPLIISRSQKKKSSSFSAVQQEEKQHN